MHTISYSPSAAVRTVPAEVHGFPVLATEKLRLRGFERSDLSRLVEIAGEHHVADSSIEVPHPFTAAHARNWIESHAAAWAGGQALHWAISLLNDDRLVGYVGLQDIEVQDRQAQLSFWIGSGARRRDHALEAVQAALAFAFDTLAMNRVCSFHLTRNALAARVLAKIGMPAEGILRQRVCKWDQFEDVTVRGLLRSEWQALQQSAALAGLRTAPAAAAGYSA